MHHVPQTSVKLLKEHEKTVHRTGKALDSVHFMLRRNIAGMSVRAKHFT